jgi:tetratricopeptide (TPR) repeat protein
MISMKLSGWLPIHLMDMPSEVTLQCKSVQTVNHAMSFSDLDHAIGISPLNHDAYFKRAKAYIGLGQSSLALEDLDQAINLALANSDYLYNRGLLRFDLDEYDSAIEDFNDAIALRVSDAYVYPRHARPFVGRGRAYLQLRKHDKVLDDANTALRLLSGNLNLPEWESYRPTINLQMADAHQLLGNAYTQLGKPEDAQSEYQQASGLR